MISKTVIGVLVLIAVFVVANGEPHPGVVRERHVIKTPIKVKVIHHYKVQKVPIIIKKHVHYFRTHEVKPVEEDTDHVPNEFFRDHKSHEHHDIWDHGHYDYEDHHQALHEDEYGDYEYE